MSRPTLAIAAIEGERQARVMITVLAAIALAAPSACRRHRDELGAPAGAPTTGWAGIGALPSRRDQDGTPDGARPRDAPDPRWPGRIAALASEVNVREAPSLQGAMLGYLRAGAVIAASAGPVSKDGCAGGWYAVAPAGFVCAEANVASTDVGQPIVKALARRPDPEARLPYMYGLVRQHSPIYSRLPTRAEAAHAEYSLRKHIEHWLRADDGAAFRAEAWMRGKNTPAPDARVLWDERTTEDVPPWLEDGAMPPGNLSGLIVGRRLVVGQTQEHQGFAFIDTAVRDGRRYAITTDLLVVPVDRVRPVEASSYHGVRIPDDIDVPFALVRREGAWIYELRGDAMVRRERVARRAAIKTTGKEMVVEGRRYFETSDGRWVAESHAAKIERYKRTTKWAEDGEHWVDVSIANQTLVAYDGTKPVYATLVSTGEAGLDDPQTTKATVLGEFRIFSKHLTTTMSSEVVGEEFQLKDIPFVQYFQEGYALHAAYWHDDFGIPRSHGCINLAPEDARWVFAWTDPPLPDGWHGARAAKDGSVVNVHP